MILFIIQRSYNAVDDIYQRKKEKMVTKEVAHPSCSPFLSFSHSRRNTQLSQSPPQSRYSAKFPFDDCHLVIRHFHQFFLFRPSLRRLCRSIGRTVAFFSRISFFFSFLFFPYRTYPRSIIGYVQPFMFDCKIEHRGIRYMYTLHCQLVYGSRKNRNR